MVLWWRKNNLACQGDVHYVTRQSVHLYDHPLCSGEPVMDELAELRTLLAEGRIEEALLLVDELDEMSREDKINKISSYMRILLIHLIKQHGEQRSTRSWEVSV